MDSVHGVKMGGLEQTCRCFSFYFNSKSIDKYYLPIGILSIYASSDIYNHRAPIWHSSFWPTYCLTNYRNSSKWSPDLTWGCFFLPVFSSLTLSLLPLHSPNPRQVQTGSVPLLQAASSQAYLSWQQSQLHIAPKTLSCPQLCPEPSSQGKHTNSAQQCWRAATQTAVGANRAHWGLPRYRAGWFRPEVHHFPARMVSLWPTVWQICGCRFKMVSSAGTIAQLHRHG